MTRFLVSDTSSILCCVSSNQRVGSSSLSGRATYSLLRSIWPADGLNLVCKERILIDRSSRCDTCLGICQSSADP